MLRRNSLTRANAPLGPRPLLAEAEYNVIGKPFLPAFKSTLSGDRIDSPTHLIPTAKLYQRDRANLDAQCNTFRCKPSAENRRLAPGQLPDHFDAVAHQEPPHIHYFMADRSPLDEDRLNGVGDSESESSGDDDAEISYAHLRRSESPDFAHTTSWHQDPSHLTLGRRKIIDAEGSSRYRMSQHQQEQPPSRPLPNRDLSRMPRFNSQETLRIPAQSFRHPSQITRPPIVQRPPRVMRSTMAPRANEQARGVTMTAPVLESQLHLSLLQTTSTIYLFRYPR